VERVCHLPLVGGGGRAYRLAVGQGLACLCSVGATTHRRERMCRLPLVGGGGRAYRLAVGQGLACLCSAGATLIKAIKGFSDSYQFNGNMQLWDDGWTVAPITVILHPPCYRGSEGFHHLFHISFPYFPNMHRTTASGDCHYSMCNIICFANGLMNSLSVQ